MKTITLDYNDYLKMYDEAKKEKEFSSELTTKLEELSDRYKELSKEKGMIYVYNENVTIGKKWEGVNTNYPHQVNITRAYIRLIKDGDVRENIENTSRELAKIITELMDKHDKEVAVLKEKIKSLNELLDRNNKWYNDLPRWVKRMYAK